MPGAGGVTVQWARADSVAVTITGPGSFTQVGVGAATFPVTITASAEFTTPTAGDYTLTAVQFGRTIYSKAFTLRPDNGTILNIEPNVGQLEDAIYPVVSTTAALAAVGNAINTTAKYTGKMVWNSTTSKPCWANGPLAADLWKDSAAATSHTPV